MAVNVQLKRSAVPGKVPTTEALQLGELAMNTHDGCIYFKRDGVNGQEIVRICGSSSNDETIVVDSFVGDGIQTQFTLTVVPDGDQYSFVTINGVDQHVDAYSITGTTLTFTEAPADGDAIEVRTISIRTNDFVLRDYQTYVYQPSTPLTTITGPDEFGKVLSYDIGKIEVYLNGSRLVNGYDYTATDTTSIVLSNAIGNGDTLEIVSLGKASFVEWDALRPGGATLTTTAGNQVVDSFSALHYRTAKYLVSVSHATEGFHSEEILLMHDGANVYITSYAQIFSNDALGTFSASISGNDVRLTFTPANINTNIKLQRITVLL